MIKTIELLFISPKTTMSIELCDLLYVSTYLCDKASFVSASYALVI